MGIFNSLKVKVLALLLGLTLITASILLYLFLSFYKQDKTAYLFDTANYSLTSYREQFKKEFEMSSNLLRKHLSHLAIDQKLSLNGETTLPEDYHIDAIFLYQKNPNLTLVDSLFKNTVTQETKDKLFNLANAAGPNDNTILIDEDFVTQVFSLGKDNLKWTVVYQYRSNVPKAFLQDVQLANILLFSKSKGVLQYNFKDISPDVIQKLSQELTKKLGPKLTQDYYTSMMNLIGGKYLVSASKLGQSDTYLISFASEDKVFENIRSLITKALLFFVILSIVILLISLVASHYLTQRLKVLTDSAEQIAQGHFDIQVPDTGKDEVSKLSVGFNKMTKEITRLLSETANKARMEAELKTAQLVQATLFPDNQYESDFIKLKGFYVSASECGGDWWYYTEDEGHIWIWIADATGHGAPAALLTSAAKSAVTIVEGLHLSPEEAMKHFNTAICSVAKENMMMTCFVAVIDKKTKMMTYINASHEPSILIQKKDEIEKDDFQFLNESSAPRLGQSKTSVFEAKQVQLSSGDRIVFYTDGVTDVQNPSGKSYGERTFLKDLVSTYNSTKDLNGFFDSYVEKITSFRSETELIDDVTFCFFELK